jgi:CBS domain-containing protein
MSTDMRSPPREEDTESLPAPALCTVEDVMVRKVLTARPDTSLQTVAELMLENGISGMPVVDEDGRLVGMVSKTDLVRQQLGEDAGSTVRLPSGHHLVDGTTVEEVMTRQVLSVRPGSSLSEAAQIMVNEGVHRVPVVGPGDVLVGLISTSDVVRWVAGLP